MEKGRISVITLSYNNLDYYEDCLKSIIMQDYENVELILCDDCSKNYNVYEEKIKSFLNRNSGNLQRIEICHNKENLGIVKNYEKAIQMTTGEYIFYLAIDDMFYDDHVLSDVVTFFEKTGSQIFTGYREVFFENGTTQKLPVKNEAEFLKKGSIQKILQRQTRINITSGAATPFRKQLIEQYGFVENGYVHLEDWPRYLNLMYHGVRIDFYERCLIRYRWGGITKPASPKNVNPIIMQDYMKLLDCYMYPPYTDMLAALKVKKYIIAWGNSSGFTLCHKRLEKVCNKKIDFVVDKEKSKWGTFVEGVEIFSPEKIKEISKEELFVLVFSQTYYIEIAQELEQMGLIEGKHFDAMILKRLIWLERNYTKNMMRIKDVELLKNYEILLNSKIILYGTGKAGRDLLKLFSFLDVNVLGFCDSNLNKRGEIVDNYLVYHTSDLKKLSDKNTIIILASIYFKEIMETIEQYCNGKIVCKGIYTRFATQTRDAFYTKWTKKCKD